MLSEAKISYLRWVKQVLSQRPRICLLESGLSTSPAVLGLDSAALLNEPSPLAPDPGIRDRLSRRYGVPPEEILPAQGASGALFLALAALLRPDNEVLVETPAYEPLVAVPRVLGGRVRHFARDAGGDWGVDPERVLATWTPKTRLAVLTNPHNPTGRAVAPADLARLAEEVASRGGYLLVDEVYGEFGARVETARSVGDAVVAVSSLTKVHGLGPLRAGWVFAPAPLVRRMEALVDAVVGIDPGPMQAWFRAGLDAADDLRRQAREQAATGWRVVEPWARDHPGRVVRPDGGIVAWMTLPPPLTGSEFARRLMEDHGVAVTPGRFFGDDSGVRFSFAGDPDPLREGLSAMAAELARAGAAGDSRPPEQGKP